MSYALVALMGRDQQVFATSAGRFRPTESRPARLRLIQQIGYRGLTLALVIERRSSGLPAERDPVVSLVPRPLVLPELVRKDASLDMQAAGGAAPEGGTILDEAYKSAERILTLEQRFPFILVPAPTAVLDSSYTPIGNRYGAAGQSLVRPLSRRAGARPAGNPGRSG